MFHFNWDQAHAWEKEVNKDKEGEFSEPEWKFDCSFKLDFDGAVVRVSSRFYPPTTHWGDSWDGTVDILIGEKCLHTEKFDEETIDELKIAVETYVKTITQEIKESIAKVFTFKMPNKSEQ